MSDANCDKPPCEQKFLSICSNLQISLEEIRDQLNTMGKNMELLTKNCNTQPTTRKRKVDGNVEKSAAKKLKANKSVEKEIGDFNLDFYQDLQSIMSSIFQPPLDLWVLSYFTNNVSLDNVGSANTVNTVTENLGHVDLVGQTSAVLEKQQ